MNAPTHVVQTSPADNLDAKFLTILPGIEQHGRIAFRAVNAERREDMVAEMVALSWAWFVRLAERGKDATSFVFVLARYAARAVRSGRRLTGSDRANDVMSHRAQQIHGFQLEALPFATTTSFENLYAAVDGQRRLDVYEERLHDNTITPPPDQAAFRIDWPSWLQTLTGRERRIIGAMALNERTKDLSKQFDLSPGRISQLRRGFHEGWERFCADPADTPTHAAV